MLVERLNTGLSRVEVADALGISKFALKAYELGYRATPEGLKNKALQIYAEHAERLCKLLKSPLFVALQERRKELVEQLVDEYRNTVFLEEDQRVVHRALIKALEAELQFIDNITL